MAVNIIPSEDLIEDEDINDENKPLLEGQDHVHIPKETLKSKLKSQRCCLLVFILGLSFLVTSIVVSYLLYFKYVIGKYMLIQFMIPTLVECL